ncbi:hypothetical protein [Flavobacterium araucananum]|uniref:hypothetical protein n=1 Tax=Flavobacterium araucananum TaxID=946678 RepID=UPI001FD3E018|nr:hypothetical protein [Flavobacterium araucananum]
MALQKLFLLALSPFSLAIQSTCSVLKIPFESSSKAHFKIDASGWSNVIYFVPSSLTLLTYPTGAYPIYLPSFLARRMP